MVELLQFFDAYRDPILQATLSVSLALLLTFLKIPSFFLHSLHTYIHPDNVAQPNSTRAAIRRPSSDSASTPDGYQNLSSKPLPEPKRKSKTKDKFEFDENNAQIFRLKLDEAHLQSRLYFNDYWYSFVYSFLAFSSFLLYKYLDGAHVGVVEHNGVLANGSTIPLVLGFVALCKVMVSLTRVSFEKSASKRSEKRFSLLAGALGIAFGLLICSGVSHSVIDYDISSVDGFGRVCIVVLMGCIAGLLYMPAGKNARCFWVGTDQVRCNMGMISCGWFARLILYANYLTACFAALLWISPLADMFLIKNTGCNATGKLASCSNRGAVNLVGSMGLTHSDFIKLRFWCLLLSGILQAMALRPNLQMFLNEALLSWYQRLHAGKVPDLEFSRAKVFLHNHYLCLVVLQFLAPSVILLVFLGFSQIGVSSFKNFQSLCSLVPCSSFVKEVSLFLAWWVVFVWTILTSASLLMYRRGTLYVS